MNDDFSEHPLRALVVFRLPIVFVAFYVLDLLAYIFVIKSAQPTYLQGFLTSPFSPYEDYTTTYSSPQLGVWYNFGIVLFIILFAEIYLRLIRPSKGRTDFGTAAFVMSIIASYVVSGLQWRFVGAPSAGTSIIGSSMILLLCAFASGDVIGAARDKPNNKAKTVPAGPIAFAVASGVVYVAEYISNSSAVAHLEGDCIFAALMTVFLLIVNKHHLIPPGKEQSSGDK